MRKRGATSWQLLVHVGTDKRGRKRYASKTVKGTKRQAEVALAELVTEVAKGELVPSEPISVEQVVERWLKAKSPRISPATVSRYRVALKHIIPAIGSMPVARLRTRDVEDLYNQLYESGQSGSSIRKVHWAMRQSLAWAKRRDTSPRSRPTASSSHHSARSDRIRPARPTSARSSKAPSFGILTWEPRSPSSPGPDVVEGSCAGCGGTTSISIAATCSFGDR